MLAVSVYQGLLRRPKFTAAEKQHLAMWGLLCIVWCMRSNCERITTAVLVLWLITMCRWHLGLSTRTPFS